MRIKPMIKTFLKPSALCFVAIAILTFFPNRVISGNLNPTASPTGTMKTLEQIEPRIPLGQADFPKTLSQSGSYYLTEDVTIAGVGMYYEWPS
jgi:hypothetical protein